MRRAVVRTDHGDAATARTVGTAVRPDNTDEMSTQIEGSTVVTTVRRGSTGGLQSTVDDYVVNLHVAAELAAPTDAPTAPPAQSASSDAWGGDTDNCIDNHIGDSDNHTDTNTDT